MRPLPILDCCFNDVCRCSVRQHHEPINEVLMDVSANECVHLVMSRSYGVDVVRQQIWKNKADGHIDTELIAAPATAGVALQAGVEALWLVPTHRFGIHAASGHAHVD